MLDDAPRLGRPVEVNSDQIETLIENNEHYPMLEIADMLKASKSIKLLVKMKNVFYRKTFSFSFFVFFSFTEKTKRTFWPTQ